MLCLFVHFPGCLCFIDAGTQALTTTSEASRATHSFHCCYLVFRFSSCLVSRWGGAWPSVFLGHRSRGVYFLLLQNLIPEVLFLSLIDDSENTRDGFVNNSDRAELGSRSACHLGATQLGWLYFHAFQLCKQHLLLATKVSSFKLGRVCIICHCHEGKRPRK